MMCVSSRWRLAWWRRNCWGTPQRMTSSRCASVAHAACAVRGALCTVCGAPCVARVIVAAACCILTAPQSYREWKKTIEPLRSEDVARVILFAFQQPRHVTLREIVIGPTRQEP